MFGIIGTAIFGIAYAIGWSTDEQREQHNRKDSLDKGLDFYVDKQGKQRWTKTGKKRTAQEILREKEELRKKHEVESKKQVEKELLKDYRRMYDSYVIHKDKLSFEEFVVTRMAPQLLNYEAFKRMKENVSEERIKEIQSNPIIYG